MSDVVISVRELCKSFGKIDNPKKDKTIQFMQKIR